MCCLGEQSGSGLSSTEYHSKINLACMGGPKGAGQQYHDGSATTNLLALLASCLLAKPAAHDFLHSGVRICCNLLSQPVQTTPRVLELADNTSNELEPETVRPSRVHSESLAPHTDNRTLHVQIALPGAPAKAQDARCWAVHVHASAPLRHDMSALVVFMRSSSRHRHPIPISVTPLEPAGDVPGLLAPPGAPSLAPSPARRMRSSPFDPSQTTPTAAASTHQDEGLCHPFSLCYGDAGGAAACRPPGERFGPPITCLTCLDGPQSSPLTLSRSSYLVAASQ